MSTIIRPPATWRWIGNGSVPPLRSAAVNKRVRRLARASGDGTSGEQWDAWVGYLEQRKQPVPLAKLLPAKRKMPPLLWALSGDRSPGSEAAQLILDLWQLVASKRPGRVAEFGEILESWLSEAHHHRPDDGVYALQCLAWCHAMPRLAGRVRPPLWGELLRHLVAAAQPADSDEAAPHPLAAQLLTGELPLTLAYLFPEVEVCFALGKAARETLSAAVEQLVDGEGLPRCEDLPLLRPLLACWTRANLLASHGRSLKLNRPARDQFAYVLLQALRFTRPDGSQVFEPIDGRERKLSSAMVSTALQLANDSECDALARHRLGHHKGKRDARLQAALPEDISFQSEWSRLAMLRPNWSAAAPGLTVGYAKRSLVVELSNRGRLLWTGPCQPAVEIDGQRLMPESEWEEVCWFCDDDAVYCELEMALGGGWRLQRQFVLAREDRLLLMADAVLGDRPAEIEYGCPIPLASGVEFLPAERTRESYLGGTKPLAALIPLALPEWRRDRRFGELSQDEPPALRLHQTARGASLYAPLLIDLHPRRLLQELTWRQLTVAESRKILPREEAVGYRIQVGEDQWLVYRSLVEPGNRTVLGQNLSTEFLLARFDREGEVETLVEVEPSDS